MHLFPRMRGDEYEDLSPIRAGLVKRPEDYRWCSLGYHVQTGNKDNLQCVDFGMREWNGLTRGTLCSYWEEDTPIHELLRGKNDQHTFLVTEQDEGLLAEMEKAGRIKDRWKRREAWRRLAGRIANVSVSVYARYGFKPEHIATEKMGHYLLHRGYYDQESGLMLESKYADSGQNSLIF